MSTIIRTQCGQVGRLLEGKEASAALREMCERQARGEHPKQAQAGTAGTRQALVKAAADAILEKQARTVGPIGMSLDPANTRVSLVQRGKEDEKGQTSMKTYPAMSKEAAATRAVLVKSAADVLAEKMAQDITKDPWEAAATVAAPASLGSLAGAIFSNPAIRDDMGRRVSSGRGVGALKGLAAGAGVGVVSLFYQILKDKRAQRRAAEVVPAPRR